jgi:hypothetical protein
MGRPVNIGTGNDVKPKKSEEEEEELLNLYLESRATPCVSASII